MAAPTLSAFPPAPARGEDRAVFTSKANALVAHYAIFVDEINNTILPWIEVQLTTVADGVTDAQQAVTDAQEQVTLVAGQVTLAATEADRSSDEADRAEIAAGNAAGAVNYRGLWTDATGSATAGGSYFYDDSVWLLLVDVPNIEATVPSLTNSDWLQTSGKPNVTTLSKNFSPSEEFILKLSDSIAGAPIVSVTKEVPQPGVTNDEWETAIEESEFDVDTGLQFGTSGLEIDLTGGTYVGQYLVATTNSAGQISTDYWTDINSMTSDDVENGEFISYALSDDGKQSFYVVSDSEGPRNIARDNGGTWEFNSAPIYDETAWQAAGTNSLVEALKDAMGVVRPTLAGAGYDNQTKDISATLSSPIGVCYASDDSRVWVVGGGSGTLYQFDLSVAGDPSTAVYNGASFTPSEDALALGVCRNADGSKLFISGSATDAVYEYDLASNNDITTPPTYSGNSLPVGGQDGNPYAIALTNSDNTLLMAGGNGSVYQYDLATTGTLGGASYSGNSYDLPAPTNNVFGLTATTDGRRMFVGSDDTCYQYEIDAAGDMTTVTDPSIQLSVAAQNSAMRGISLNSDETGFVVVGNIAPDSFFGFSLGFSATNKMDGPQLAAAGEADFQEITTTLDLAVILRTDDGGTTPTSNGVTINYDGNVAREVAVNGTDYTFQLLSDDRARITWIGGDTENIKARVK